MRADEEAGSAPTVDWALDAEITSYKADKDKYPNIWKLAGCILAIPATLALSERVFSGAASIVNKKRACLKPETFDLLIFLRGNKDLVSGMGKGLFTVAQCKSQKGSRTSTVFPLLF